MLTRFNAILGTLFVVVLVVGPLQDGLFGIVLVVNTSVGVAQEVRAKRTLDRLAVLTAPRAHALRDGVAVDLAVEEVVVGDLLLVRPGDQVVADGTVREARGLEVDESLLSGEALPVAKVAGGGLLSGSVVVAGTGTMEVGAVGDEAYAQRLQGDARRFSLVRSELQQGTNRLLRMITWVMVPVGVLLITSQLWRSGEALDDAVRGSVAGVGAMVPEGLVLLTTIAFALGALRLARRRVLVQELAAIEGLARVDVLCVDKTGTLTEPAMDLVDVVVVDDGLARAALGAVAAADPAPNATMTAARSLPVPDGWEVRGTVPFSSARKWSAVDFGPHGTWVVGAPDVIAPDLPAALAGRAAEESGNGRRVLAVARSPVAVDGGTRPSGLDLAGIAVFEERVRAEAPATVAYLLDQGVALRVLSGDAPGTVGAVAARVGIPGADAPVDARDLPSEPEALARALDRATVFGRVQPQQKRDIVTALQAAGHVVAMTGDGVNDVLALKAADLGMAMGSGSPASRAVGRLVLLDDSFAVVPHIVDEGRRVIANVQRVANLFVTKTVYATVLAVVVGLAAVPYPFYPRHLTVVSAVTIGIPGFFLALAPGAPRARPGFVGSVLRFTVPAGLVAAAAVLFVYLMARQVVGTSEEQARTAATLVLVALGLVVLAMIARPLDVLRGVLVAAMAGVAVLVWAIPLGRRIFALDTPPGDVLWLALAAVVVAAPALVVAVGAVRRRWGDGGPGI
ncbi:MAG TPA: HAD-IC family P-type ATPase [Acidimicrobiales bacterium]|nr:HAD-IC family P-type ATPase [Acidimicrobiales bacterium]